LRTEAGGNPNGLRRHQVRFVRHHHRRGVRGCEAQSELGVLIVALKRAGNEIACYPSWFCTGLIATSDLPSTGTN